MLRIGHIVRNIHQGIQSRIGQFFRKKKIHSEKREVDEKIKSETTISHDLISNNALKVLQRLMDYGYEAYLVGGCIRDLLLGIRPKDFDIATDAHPEQVRRLFRNSRIIGRRFKLVHVVFGREIIEVATFRASHDSAKTDAHALQDSESGRILKDNVYGTIQDDAVRRDFTVNALYYGGNSYDLVDFSGGLNDLDNRVLRLLGEPEQRYREDPVRMLRAVRFAAKLDFSIAEDTLNPVRALSHLLEDIPPARLFDEVLKMFLNGKGMSTLILLREFDLFGQLFPGASRTMSTNNQAKVLLEAALKSTDQRVQNNKAVTPAFFYAALLWHSMMEQARQLQEQDKLSMLPAMQKAAELVIRAQCGKTAIPRRFSYAVRDIWELQPHLEKHALGKIEKIIAHPRFRAAYDLLLLREASGEYLKKAGQWWTEYQEKNQDLMIAARNSRKESFQRSGNTSRRYRQDRPKKNTENKGKMSDRTNEKS